MTCYSFITPGPIDLRALFTLGVSVKTGDSPIGYFGTGAKFAVAWCLRNGCKIEIETEGKTHVISARTESIRGQDFGLIYLDETPLGFTSALGRNWEAWMAYRELASNTMDEKGEIFPVCMPAPLGHSSIHIYGDAFEAGAREHRKIFFESKAAIFKNSALEIIDKPSAQLYYRGVRVSNLEGNLSMLTYNVLTPCALTEDRTLRSLYEMNCNLPANIISSLLAGGEPERALLLRICCLSLDSYEGRSFSWPNWNTDFNTWLETLPDNTPLLPKLGAIRRDALMAKARYKGRTLATREEKMLARAQHILNRANLPITYPIVSCDSLGRNVHGQARDGKIWISASAFSKGTRELAATLLEEQIHLQYEVSDETRNMQNKLFDLLLGQVEESTGELF